MSASTPLGKESATVQVIADKKDKVTFTLCQPCLGSIELTQYLDSFLSNK